MSVCKYCEGTGKLGLQRESCFYCEGDGYIKEKISLNKNRVEMGLESLIEKQLRMIREINKNNAYTKEECEKRLSLINDRDLIDYILNMLFDIQSYQYTKSDYGGIDIN